MPPKKKKAPRNAFFFFMMDWKKEKEEQGQRFQNLQEVTLLCSEDWKHLPERNMQKYKDMEKAAKGRDKDDKANKFDSLGKPFTQIDNEKMEILRAHERMCCEIDDVLSTLARNVDSLKSHCFFLIHCNVHCYWGFEKRYIPAEVAITKFNLKSGVLDTYHVFPAPNTANGDIPLGYRFEVKQNTDNVHDIPDPREFDLVERDWEKIREDLYKFLGSESRTNLPPIFTMSGDDANTNCYEMACRSFLDTVSNTSDEDFRVYDLPLFFFKLYEKCQDVAVELFNDDEEAFIVEGVAHQQLTKDIYNHEPGITCRFHTDTDHYNNCSKSFVQRWVYLMCEFCCKALRIDLIPGRHCILSAEVTPHTETHLKNRSQPLQQMTSSASSGLRNLTLGDKSTTSNAGAAGAWGGRMQSENELQSYSQSKDLLIIDRSVVPDPAQTRVLRTGQSANVVSEIRPEPSNVRLPTTMGRGEMMARALSMHAGMPSLSADDFPALGSNRPGRLEKPLTTGWGRGFLKK